jgi:hypothetical protein
MGITTVKFKLKSTFVSCKSMNMKLKSIIVLLITTLFLSSQGYSQVVNASTKKKISVGIGLTSDIMMNMPSGIKARVINHGATVFATYNLSFGKSNYGVSIGAGLSSHNIYGNFIVDSRTEMTTLNKIPDSIDYKHSKITLVYAEIPVEFRFKSKSKVSVGVGFKAGFMIGSSAKYVGNGVVDTTLSTNFNIPTEQKTRIKFWGLKNLEQITYGPTLRIGYKWINLTGYYMLSTLFTKGRGPEMYPITVGLVVMPF